MPLAAVTHPTTHVGEAAPFADDSLRIGVQRPGDHLVELIGHDSSFFSRVRARLSVDFTVPTGMSSTRAISGSESCR